MGSATVFSEWTWDGDRTCTPSHTTVVWMKVEGLGGHAWVRDSPVIPAAGGPGFNSPGSPNWDELLCSWENTRKVECFDEASAKRLWVDGEVTDFELAWDGEPSRADSDDTPASSAGIDFGDNASPYAHDGECDDRRFEGPGMFQGDNYDSDIRHDADDCRAEYEAGRITLR